MALSSRRSSASASATEDMIHRNGPTSEEDQGEGKGGESERKFGARAIWGAHKSVVPMHLPERHNQVDANRKSCSPGKKTSQDQQTPDEFHKRRDIAQPRRHAKVRNQMNVVLHVPEDILISVGDHHGAQCQTHGQQCEWL